MHVENEAPGAEPQHREAEATAVFWGRRGPQTLLLSTWGQETLQTSLTGHLDPGTQRGSLVRLLVTSQDALGLSQEKGSEGMLSVTPLHASCPSPDNTDGEDEARPRPRPRPTPLVCLSPALPPPPGGLTGAPKEKAASGGAWAADCRSPRAH